MGIRNFISNRKAKRFRRKHKIGLCLSGGGTRGFAYIGVFKALEEAGIKFDAVAGTSVGSIFASMYAGGVSSSEMLRFSRQIKNSDFKNTKLGFLPSSMDRLESLLDDKLPIKKVEDAKIPLYIPAVDLKSGREICFKSGDLSKIICGSCSVPGAFHPVKYREYLLIDGGCRNNVPADLLRKNGCDYVVTIDCNSTRGKGTSSKNFFTKFWASLDIMTVNNSIKGLDLSDIIITPNLDRFSSLNVEGKEEMIEEGYKATNQAIFKIQSLLKGKYKRYVTKEDNKFNNMH